MDEVQITDPSNTAPSSKKFRNEKKWSRPTHFQCCTCYQQRESPEFYTAQAVLKLHELHCENSSFSDDQNLSLVAVP
jgi:hypothetical protein